MSPPRTRTLKRALYVEPQTALVDPAAPDDQIPVVKHHGLSWRDGELGFLEDEFSPITPRGPYADRGRPRAGVGFALTPAASPWERHLQSSSTPMR